MLLDTLNWTQTQCSCGAGIMENKPRRSKGEYNQNILNKT